MVAKDGDGGGGAGDLRGRELQISQC